MLKTPITLQMHKVGKRNLFTIGNRHGSTYKIYNNIQMLMTFVLVVLNPSPRHPKLPVAKTLKVAYTSVTPLAHQTSINLLNTPTQQNQYLLKKQHKKIQYIKLDANNI
jgi:hypothetical protein